MIRSPRPMRMSVVACRCGNMTVELALLTALLVPLLLGLYEIAARIHQTMQLGHAVRAGAEYAMTYPSDTAGIEAAVVQASRIDPTGLAVAVSQFCECPDGAPVGCSDTCPAGEQANAYVRVAAAQASKSPLGSGGFIADAQVRAQATMRVR